MRWRVIIVSLTKWYASLFIVPLLFTQDYLDCDEASCGSRVIAWMHQGV